MLNLRSESTIVPLVTAKHFERMQTDADEIGRPYTT